MGQATPKCSQGKALKLSTSLQGVEPTQKFKNFPSSGEAQGLEKKETLLQSCKTNKKCQ